MTQDQIMGLLRQVLQIAGTLATSLGFLAPDVVAHWTAVILQVAGPIAMLVGIVWNLIANKQTSIAASIGANPATTVKPAGDGSAVVTIKDPEMAKAALQADKTTA